MDRKQLISLLSQSAADRHERTPFCPSDEDIAGFVDGDLTDTARVTVARHLPDCQACVSRVGLLTRLLREHEPLIEAHAPQRFPASRAPYWAVAATVVFAAGWLFWAPDEVPVDYQSTRKIESVLTSPEVIIANSETAAGGEGLSIRWAEVPGSLYYEVRIVSDGGDLLSRHRVYETHWRLAENVGLQPGREYYVRVDAYLSDAQTIRSEHIPFRLRE